MKKTPFIFAVFCILLNTSFTYTAPGDVTKQKKTFTWSCNNNCYRAEYIGDSVTEVEISTKCSNNSTLTVDIPLSVKKIILNGEVSNNSSIYLYMRHNPDIDTSKFYYSDNATIQIMHPIRKYTYHIAALAACGILAYYFTTKE